VHEFSTSDPRNVHGAQPPDVYYGLQDEITTGSEEDESVATKDELEVTTAAITEEEQVDEAHPASPSGDRAGWPMLDALVITPEDDPDEQPAEVSAGPADDAVQNAKKDTEIRTQTPASGGPPPIDFDDLAKKTVLLSRPPAGRPRPEDRPTAPVAGIPIPLGDVVDASGLPQDKPAITEQTGQSEVEPDPRERVSFRFVECEHSAVNGERIAQALDGCKTVIFEAAGGKPFDRQKTQFFLDAAVDRTLPYEVRQDCRRQLDEQIGPGYIQAVLDHLPSSVERAKIFDVGANHPAYQEALKWREQHIEYSDKIATYAPNNTLRQSLTELIPPTASMSHSRESIMAEQLTAIATEEAAEEPHIDGVVTGLAHKGTRLRMSADGFDCTVTPPITDEYAIESLAAIGEELVHQYMEDPTMPINPTDVDRAILEATALQHLSGAPRAYEAAKGLSDERVTEVMDALDHIKQSPLSYNEKAGLIMGELDKILRPLSDAEKQEMDQELLRRYFNL
jgi:hypothetical protein